MDSQTLTKIEFDAIRCLLGEYCACSLGRSLAARISPSRNPQTIVHWLEQTTQMVEALRDVGLPPFGGISDIRAPMQRAVPGGGATPEDFAIILAALRGAANVRAFLTGLPESLDKLHAMAGQIGAFDGEVKAIERVIGPDGEVLDSASPRLGELRREIEATGSRIREVIYGYLKNPQVTRLLENQAVTLHGDRYVLPVRADNRGRLPGVVHRASNTGQTVFVEPNASVELNNKLADLRDDERREIRRLLNELAVRIQHRGEEILSTMRMLAHVDLLSAKAQYAYQFEMTCPEVAERIGLELHDARHPLLVDQAHQQARAGIPPEKRHPVVPIDVRLGDDFDLLIITGSNTGGKTVALKTVALLTVMAQAGMHIPARRGSKLPIVRDVFVDIGDEQSLQQSLSTFGGHIKRIRYCLQKADRNCLVLLDELGAGTDPDEGGAIGQAVLDELREIGCLGMVTTHLSVLKAYAFTHERVDNASVEFDTKTLSPTYRLLIGQPGESHAITVARRLGMPRRITGAAKQYLSRQGKQFSRAIKATAQVRKTAEEARAEAAKAELDARNQQEVYESRLADLHRLREQFEHWLARLPELQAGDEVHVPSLKKAGRLVRIEWNKQAALVDVDGKTVQVPLRELMPDLGQRAVREQMDSLKQEILQQAQQAKKVRAEAEHAKQEYHRSLEHHRARARQFEQWLEAVGEMKVGDVVPIAGKPGKGQLLSVDLLAMRATVLAGDREREIPLQDLFPGKGAFRSGSDKGRGSGSRARSDKRGGRHAAREKPTKDRPIPRRSPQGAKARKAHDALLHVKPGEQVFVVPFNKRATLVRIDEDKDQVVVQSGVFEMEVPLADVEPVRSGR